MKLIHTSPLGGLIIAGVGEVEPGEPFDIDAAAAAILLEQADLYRPAQLSVAELRANAKDLGIKTTGLKTTADLEAAIAAATEGDSE